jgi:hypothetical protein
MTTSKLPDNIFRKAVKNPSETIEFLKTKCYNLHKKPYLMAKTVNQFYYQRFCHAGDLDIMDEDWDTLLLADACRYDFFKQESTLPGDLESRFSPASMSYGFIEANFFNRKLHDTVYVTANPFAAEIPEKTFHDVISLIDEYYENSAGTVPPEVLREKTQEAHAKYPNKRIIAHFMQPHEPFLSDFGQEVSENLIWTGNQYHLSTGQTIKDLRRAYRENVNILLKELEKLIKEIDGRVAVSADHGEMLGERLRLIPIRGYEHPESIYTEELLKVPWLIIDKGDREIITEPPKSSESIASEEAKSRLEKLGYI